MSEYRCQWQIVYDDDLGRRRAFTWDVQSDWECPTLLYLDILPVTSALKDPATFADTLPKMLSRLSVEEIDVELIILREFPDLLLTESELSEAHALLKSLLDVVPSVLSLRTVQKKDFLGEPELHHLFGPQYDSPDKLSALVRELEFTAYLHWSNAVSRPADAHFELPNGAHASAFIRVADALTSYKQISRVADWIQVSLTKTTVIVVDTWTILPLAQELALRVFKSYEAEMPIYSFPSYPTLGNVEQMFGVIRPLLLGNLEASVTFLLTVASSQAFYGRVASIRLPQHTKSNHVVLVDASADEDLKPFTRILGIERYDVPEGVTCDLCRNPKTAHVVRIDARRYSPVVYPVVKQVMLSVSFAQKHADFWEVVSNEKAASVHRDFIEFNTGKSTHIHIYIDVARLLNNHSFMRECVAALLNHSVQCDLVLIPDTASTEALKELVRRAYGDTRVHLVTRESSADDAATTERRRHAREALAAQLDGVRSIVILDDSITHGHTMRAVHRLIQDTYTGTGPAPKYQIRGFVVLGRPPSEPLWARLEASLSQGGKKPFLACAKKLVIPNAPGRCPWCEEHQILRWEVSPRLHSSTGWSEFEGRTGVMTSELPLAREAVNTRVNILSPLAQDEMSGLNESIYVCRSTGQINRAEVEHISPHSLFGESLDEVTAYAAVATAMQEIRETWRDGNNVLHGWAVAKVLTAYHDPLLSAAFLRAVYSEELIGFGRDEDIEAALDEISFASPNPDLRQSPLLAGELKWAMLVGKIGWKVWSKFADRVNPLIGSANPELALLLNAAQARRP